MCGDVKCIRGRCDMCIRGRCDMCIGDRQQCMGRRGKSTWGGARVHGEEGCVQTMACTVLSNCH